MNQVATTVMIPADEYNVVKTALLQCNIKLQSCKTDVNTLNSLLRDKGYGQGEIDYMAYQEEQLQAYEEQMQDLNIRLGLEIGQKNDKLIECQADNKKLRELVELSTEYRIGNPAYEQALAQPADDTALKQLLAAERTRCAMEVRRSYKGSSSEIWNDAVSVCEQAIHALGDE